MKNKFLRLLGIIFLFATTAGVFWYFTYRDLSEIKEQLNESKKELENIAQETNPDDVLALALNNIELSQGASGIEEWRLKASWAKMRQEGDVIDLQQPIVTYFLESEGNHDVPEGASEGAKEPSEELHVNADFGIVNQKAKQIVLNKNVVAVMNDSIMRTDLMKYDGETRQLNFPESVSFHGPGFDGRGDSLFWYLDQQLLEAHGNIEVEITLDEPEANNHTPAKEGSK